MSAPFTTGGQNREYCVKIFTTTLKGWPSWSEGDALPCMCVLGFFREPRWILADAVQMSMSSDADLLVCFLILFLALVSLVVQGRRMSQWYPWNSVWREKSFLKMHSILLCWAKLSE